MNTQRVYEHNLYVRSFILFKKKKEEEKKAFTLIHTRKYIHFHHTRRKEIYKKKNWKNCVCT